MLGGNATVVLLFLMNAVFRGAGNATIAMRVLWFGNIINIVLGPCFIFGVGPFPELGVVGAAVATNIGRGSAVLYQLFTLARGRGRVRIASRHLGLDLDVMSTRGTPLGVGHAADPDCDGQLHRAGADHLDLRQRRRCAGYTIGIRLIIFALLPSFGVSNAAATMVGQNLGAGRPDRAEEAVWSAARYNAIFLGSVATLFILLATPIISAFTSDPSVLPYGIACLRIVSAGFLFYAYGMVITQSFNGAGATWTPTIINLFVFWLWEIPLAYTLAKPIGLGPQGVFWAMAVAYSTLAVVSAAMFTEGPLEGGQLRSEVRAAGARRSDSTERDCL